MSFSTSNDFLRCRSDENLRYPGQESELDYLANSLNSMSITSSASCQALRNFAKNKKVDSHIAQLAVWLNGSHFSTLPVVDIQANMLLVLCRYSHSQSLEELSLLSRMLPYYISYLSIHSEQLSPGIISEQLERSLDTPHSQLLYDLDLRVEQFLKGNTFCRTSKKSEWHYLIKLIQKLALNCESTIQDAFTASLTDWSSVVSPEAAHFAAVLRRVTEITCSLSRQAQKAPVITYFTYTNRLLISAHCYDEFLKELYEWQRDEFAAGKDISNYAGFLEIVLISRQPLKYADFTTEHKLVSSKLLIEAWKRTEDPRYLDVLALALPYVASQIELPLDSSLSFTVEAAADALDYYALNKNPSFEELKSLVKLFSSYLPERHATCALLERFAQKAEENVDRALGLLHALCVDPNNTSLFEWAEALEDEAVIRLFVQLVNSPHYSEATRENLVAYLLRAEAPKRGVEVALMLLPSMRAAHIPTLLDKVESGDCVESFASQVAHLSAQMRDTVYEALTTRPELLKKFENALRKDPLHPGIDFLIGYIQSKHGTRAQRKELVAAFCDPMSPSHYLPLTLRVLHSLDIEPVIDVLLERIKKDPECAREMPFFIGVNSGKVSWHVRDCMCRYLLQINSPESILLLAEISQDLPLSALWALIERIDSLKPKGEPAQKCRRLALRSLLFARWYNDYFPGRSKAEREQMLTHILAHKKAGTIFQPPSVWYQTRDIILYTPDDSYAHRIPDRIGYLMRTCGLTDKTLQRVASEKIAEIIHNQNAQRMEGKKKMRSPYKDYLKFFTYTAHTKRLAAAQQEIQVVDNSAVGEELELDRASPNPESQD